MWQLRLKAPLAMTKASLVTSPLAVRKNPLLTVTLSFPSLPSERDVVSIKEAVTH